MSPTIPIPVPSVDVVSSVDAPYRIIVSGRHVFECPSYQLRRPWHWSVLLRSYWSVHHLLLIHHASWRARSSSIHDPMTYRQALRKNGAPSASSGVTPSTAVE